MCVTVSEEKKCQVLLQQYIYRLWHAVKSSCERPRFADFNQQDTVTKDCLEKVAVVF